MIKKNVVSGVLEGKRQKAANIGQEIRVDWLTREVIIAVL